MTAAPAPARVNAEVQAACTGEALRAVNGLHLLDVARVDTIVDSAGLPWVQSSAVSSRRA